MIPLFFIFIGLVLGLFVSYLFFKSSERKRMKVEKELSQDFNLAFKAIDVYVWKFDECTQIIKFIRGNFNGNSTYGYNECKELMHPDDRKFYNEIHEDFVSGRKNEIKVDLRFFINDEYRVLRTVMISKRDSNGKLKEVVGSFLDVTKAVENEKEVQNLLCQNRIILNNINCGLLFISNDNKILWENEHNPNNPLSYCMICRERNLYDCKKCATFICKKTRKIEISERIIEDKKIRINGIPIYDNDTYIGTVVRVDDITDK